MSNWFLENPEEDEITETEQQMRDRHIRSRLRKAQESETVKNMIERYKDYGQPI